MYTPTSFIGGKPVEGSGGKIEVYSPIDEKPLASGRALVQEEMSSAFISASLAFENWKQVDYKLRSKFLLAFASKLREHAVALSQIIHKEVGKGLKAAHDEVIRSQEYIVESVHAYSEMMEKLEEYDGSNNVLIPKNLHATYVRIPLGVIFSISPFNYPVNLMITKIIPALLTGNTVVHKSATNGSVSGWYVSKLLHEVTVEGYPITPGAYNYLIVKGSDLGNWSFKDLEISALSFTGSSQVGKSLSEKMPPRTLLQLELGGHNPAVVMEDADLDLATEEIVKGAFQFSGQRCTSIKRLLLHNRIKEKFLKKLETALEGITLEEPLISKWVIKSLQEYYQEALEMGAFRVGKELEVKGNYVTPVVLKNTRKGMKIHDEEIFAPVLSINYYQEEDEIVNFCNDSRYGLQASIFGKDIDNIANLSLKLEFGRININAAPSRSPDCLPFGGLKDSGVGFQGINESLLFFTTRKGIVLKQRNEQ